MKPMTITRITIKDTEDGGVTTLVEFEGDFDPDNTRPSQAFALEMMENMGSTPESGWAVPVAWSKKEVERKTQRKF